ncbi:MAG: hypothetical protein M0T70_15675 [Geobacteraceae bacterium]|nr:hypothetical protein [Geobacteraceae bacterium]
MPDLGTDNGTGRNERGNELALSSAWIAVPADDEEVLSGWRCYKERWDNGDTEDHPRDEAGKRFDQELAETFFDCVESIEQLTIFPASDP